jgi:hypothetical protein
MHKHWLLLGLLAAAGFGEETDSVPRQRVLVELFTSQG